MRKLHGIQEEMLTTICPYCLKTPDVKEWKTKLSDGILYKVNKSCCGKELRLKINHLTSRKQDDFFIDNLVSESFEE